MKRRNEFKILAKLGKYQAMCEICDYHSVYNGCLMKRKQSVIRYRPLPYISYKVCDSFNFNVRNFNTHCRG